MSARIPIDKGAVADFCRKWHVSELALFGSVLRDDFGPDSDVDVLVRFDGDRTPGLGFITMQDELSAMFGRQVDLLTRKFISPFIRERVLAEAEVQFAA